MIKTKDLVKIYTTEELETTALNNVNLDIKKGEELTINYNGLVHDKSPVWFEVIE